ncbi:MAG: SCO family protein [Candidatus Sulfotelmatobacter sp.]
MKSTRMAVNYTKNKSTFGIGIIAAILCTIAPVCASQKYDVTGILLKTDRQHQSIYVSCNPIPGFMDAMVMAFQVSDPTELEGLKPGMSIEFSLVVQKDLSLAENLHARPFESLDLDPTAARRFKLMENAMPNRSTVADVLQVGQRVPDFALTDQTRQRVSLSEFEGKVVAITFIYTRCPRPDYCIRLSNNFGLLQRRFKSRMGRDLILLTVVIDPVHDQPEALSSYARTWKADARNWHFLTGPLPDIQQLCRRFDMAFYPDEGLLVHSFHTVVIDRSGNLAANVEGNDFTAQQLGDLVQTVLVPAPR